MQELEENNKIVKIIDLFKKSGDTRGKLYAKMGTIKDIKVKDLTEADGNVFLGFPCFLYDPMDLAI